MSVLITVAVSYLLGCISVSIFLSRLLYGRDVRKLGSGNAGATNMARSFGIGIGVLTLAGDFLKAAVSMMLGKHLLGDWGVCLAGICCISGHCYPVLHHFKGGKGVAVGSAIAFAIDWRMGLISLAVFFPIVLLTKKVSAGSIGAAIAVAVAALVMDKPLPLIMLALFASLLVVFRHRENIKRMINGTEPNFRAGKHNNTDRRLK